MPGSRPDSFVYVDEETLFEMVPLDRVFSDRYCRPIRLWQVARLRRGWGVARIGSLYVSYRDSDGRYACLDGNHRVAAARLEGVTHLPARVYIDLGYEQEAELYNAFATQHRQSALDRFRALIEAKDRMALEIVDMLEGFGLGIALSGPALGKIQAVYALEGIYRDHGMTVLRMVIRILHSSWDTAPAAYVAASLYGTAALVARYDDKIDEHRLIQVLRKAGIEYVTQHAAGLRQIRQVTVTAWGRAMHELYNRGLRKSKLGPWEDRDRASEEARRRAGTPAGPMAAKPRP